MFHRALAILVIGTVVLHMTVGCGWQMAKRQIANDNRYSTSIASGEQEWLDRHLHRPRAQVIERYGADIIENDAGQIVIKRFVKKVLINYQMQAEGPGTKTYANRYLMITCEFDEDDRLIRYSLRSTDSPLLPVPG